MFETGTVKTRTGTGYHLVVVQPSDWYGKPQLNNGGNTAERPPAFRPVVSAACI
jgi:hypothetical protein